MKTRFATVLLAGVASVVLMSACSTPEDSVEATLESATAELSAPVLQAEAPTGQLPEGVRPTAYRLDLVTDPNAATFTGHAEIDLALEKPHARIWLHALGPVVSSVKAVLPDGMEIAATFTGDEAADGVSRIDFAAPLPAGTATLVLKYEAPYDLNLAGLYKVEQAGRPYLVTQMEAIDARRMFPSFDEPRFKTPYTLTVTAPAGMEVAANGAETGSEDLGNGMVRHSFATTRPIQSYLVALMVGPYDKVVADQIAATDLRAEPVPLRGFAPAGKGEKLSEGLDITDEMLAWQEAYFDYPYPYGKLDLIAAADFAYGAMENAGAIVYREAALLIDDRTSLARQRAIFNTHAHELGHQWFGNLVTPAWWNDIWLNEAFATWISSKTMNGIDPDGEWDLAPIQSSLTAMPTDSLASTRQIRNPIRTNGDINDAFDSITYRKGGSVLNMFETYLGEDTFRDGIRLHMRRFEDGVATADDFMQSLADGSGQPDVVSSFTSFITQPGIPFLDVQVSCTGQTGELAITQSRYAPLGSTIDTEAQTWEIPFAARVHDASGDQIVRKMLTSKTSTITLDSCPDWVMPNAGGAGYWRFVTNAGNAAALRENFASLSTAEQMMLTDSLHAGFDAGKVSAEDFVSGLEAAAGGSAAAVSTSIGMIGTLKASLGEDGKAELASWVEANYGPVGEYLSDRPATALTISERLLAPKLWNFLLSEGNRAEDRNIFIGQAKAYLGIGQTADPTALPAEDLGAAVATGVEDEGQDFYEGALAYVRGSQNQTERATILSAIAGNGSEAIVTDLFKRALGDEISGNELYTIYHAALANPEVRPVIWPMVKTNFASIAAKIPSVRKPQTASAAGYFCTADEVADAKAFFESQAELIPGYERTLMQGVERGELCSALKASTSDAVKAVFSED
ncbi:M1 family metallopeptidase [uncultured Hyphomonas sp.]|uniref:M1 family metallopeptidase n=1 Tax=uncultured Hyphomonas sp. TaxID=225298 RepID=UPI002AAAAD33|nr:M1 family metallopeptidase [uncultured Hyphomonas sp.]